ncbi:MAG TPA: hypothetical protein PKK15_05915 [Kouleothrix sp.]|nr:hypothetical protein [Kouleothrix sp.]
MAIWETLPTFYDNAGQLDSATDLNTLRAAAGLVDRWTYRADPLFDSSTGVDTNTPGYYATVSPLRIWWGGVRYISGCTTLTVEMKGQLSGSETIKVYWNGTDASGSGTLAMTLTPPGSFGAFSGTYALPGGLTDGDVYRIEIRIEGTHSASANYQVQDVYLSPVTKSGWSAAPSFSASTVNAANLNALATSIQWVYDRMRLVPIVPHLRLWYNLGPFKDPSYGDPQHTNRPMIYGSIGRYTSTAELRITGVVQSLTTSGWSFVVQLNGATAYSSPTYGVGTQAIDLRLPLTSYALGSRVAVAILATCSNGGTSNPPRFTRWTLSIMHAVAPSGGWPYASLPAKFGGPAQGTTPWSTVVSGLNSLATVVNNAKARIDARPEQWGRIRAMRRHYTRNIDTEFLLQARARPIWPWRTGAELYVKGANVEVQWGVLQAPVVDANANGWEQYSMSQKQTIDGSATGATVYLDDLPGLDIGSFFTLFGDPWWAGEYIG